MQISTTYSSTSLSLFAQASQASLSATAQALQAPVPRDQVEVSQQALESSRKAGRGETGAHTSTLELVSDLLGQVSGGEVEELSAAPQGEFAASFRQGSLAAESVSLSVGGTITTKDGKELGFSLELQYDHAKVSAQSASVQAGPEGISLNYEGAAAELTSTSFSFTLTTAGEGGKSTGKGSFRLNDEVSHVAKELKPLAKEFMDAAGMRGGWGQVNRFLRSIV